MFSLKSVATVGGLTLASRALGFLREILIARLMGTSPVAEAFFVAMRLPNLFRQLFAEGAFNSAFVPMFARQLEEGGAAAAKRFAEHVLGVLLMVLLLVTLVAELTMPFLIRAFAPGFHAFPEKFQLAVLYTEITFPYLVFMSLGALQGGILNAFGRFAEAAAAPILLNVVLIVVLFGIVPYTGHAGEVLSVAVTVAGVFQFLWLAISCQRAGMHLRLPIPRFTPDDTVKVAAALTAISLGLPAYILNKALSPGFLAREDTMTPFRFAMIGVGADIAISLILFHFIGYVGIALGTAGAAWINCGLLYFTLRRRGYLVIDRKLKRTLPRLFLSAVGLGLALWFGIKPLEPYLRDGELVRAVALAVLVAGGLGVYLVLVIATGAMPLKELARFIKRR
jgi:peptidoglycan biosynthesis protein MviN/MurJ (putative lipid II flippase)